MGEQLGPDTPTFFSELTDLINRYSMENRSNTPDYILASYMLQSLLALELAIKHREAFNKVPAPTPTPSDKSSDGEQ